MIRKRNIRLSVESRRNRRRRYESRTDDERRMALSEFLRKEQDIKCTADDLESTGYYTYCDTEDNGWFIGTDDEADKFARDEMRRLIEDGAMPGSDDIDTICEDPSFWNVDGIRDALRDASYDDEESEEIDGLDDYEAVMRYADGYVNAGGEFAGAFSSDSNLDSDAVLDWLCFERYDRADSISDNNREFVFTDKRGNEWVIAHNDAYCM